MLIATHQSSGKPGFLAVLLPLAALEPVLIVVFHQNLIQVVQVVDISMALVAAGLVAWYMVEQRIRRFEVTASPSTAPTLLGAPQLRVNR